MWGSGGEFNSDLLGVEFDNKAFDDVETTPEKELLKQKDVELAKRNKKKNKKRKRSILDLFHHSTKHAG